MSAMFELAEGGVGVMPDPDDNPDGHVVPHHDAGVRISVEVGNVGDEPGSANLRVEVDEVFVAETDTEELAPGETTVVFFNLGRLEPCQRVILVFVNPGSGQHDHAETTIELP
jgi:hypothetical protein